MTTIINRDHVERLFEPYWADSWPREISCGAGWLNILAYLAQEFGTVDQPIQVQQIKEKFGFLRIYVTTDSQQVKEWVRAAEMSSQFTCEVCGSHGELGVRNYWWSVRCAADAPEGWVVADDDEGVEAALSNWMPGES